MKTAIEKIHVFERFGSVLGLERMTELARRLGDPQKAFSVIHVAGTNGKGSVCRYLYEILRENGYRAGIYISPFVQRFHERIELDGAFISEEDLEACTAEVLQKTDEMIAAGFDSPTEFEIVTAVAFLYFQRKHAEVVVLEVGLGGSGDSTNIVEAPLVSVITSISFDHMDRLGNTLSAIATEKAGIIKQGVPVVANVEAREAAQVIARKAYEKNSALFDVTKVGYTIVEKRLDGYRFSAVIGETNFNGAEISMIGEHQVKNALTALCTVEVLRKSGRIRVEREKLYAGMKKAVQVGRLEILREDPLVIADGAHNQGGAEALEKTVAAHFAGKRVLMVCGMLADRDAAPILAPFCRIADEFIATEPDSPRKLSAVKLRDKLAGAGKACIAIPDAAAAAAAALEKGKDFDVVLFAGSLYLIGKIRRVLCDGAK